MAGTASASFLGPVAGVDGVVLRRYRGLDEIPAMAAANQATRDAAGIQGRIDVDMMRSQYSHLVNCDPEQDIVVLEAEGAVVGYARVDWNDQTDGTRELGLVALTRAGWTGRGLERLLVAWADARRAEIARDLPAPGPELHLGAFTFDGEPSLAEALRAAGYSVADRAYEMERSPLDDIVLEPVPDGLEVRAGRPEDVQSVWEAMVEAFRDHPGEIEDSEEDYRRFLDHPRFDPASWVIAVEGDEVCGGILTDVDPEPVWNRAGWLEEVFVRRPWRRRGLARAMIGRALLLVRERGATRALLGVAGANPNQAMTLYESAGFRIVSSSSRWTKPFPEASPDG